MASLLKRRRSEVPGFLRPLVAKLPSPSAPTSAYVHLPFCAQRCSYCAFPVVVSGRSALPATGTQGMPPPSSSHEDYVDLLCREIRAVANRFGPHNNASQPLSTLYLGGGTPSLLHPTLLHRVVTTIGNTIGLQPNAEVTCEMDPATFTQQSADAFRELGVNRASVGAQSFDDDQLTACRRIHTSADIEPAVRSLRTAGFDNISLDLISGLPGQSLASWRNSLNALISLEPDHVSAYDLTLEEGTEFGRKFSPGGSPLPSESTAAEMMRVTAGFLQQAGYEHYEVSNYAKRTGSWHAHELPSQQHRDVSSPLRSRHNMAYWRNEPFYSFGLGSTSVLDGFRFARPRRMVEYRKYVENVSAGVNRLLAHPEETERGRETILGVLYPHVRVQSLTEKLEDFLINSFRLLIDGVQLSKLQDSFGELAHERFVSAVQRNGHLVDQGLISLEYDTSGRDLQVVRLTSAGALIENSVLSTLMQEAVWKYPA